MKTRTTETLRQMLFDAIEDVRSGKLDRTEATTIAKLAEKIVQTAELELNYAETISRLDRADTGVSPGPLLLTEDNSVKGKT